MKRILALVVMVVLFLALYGFELHLPTPNGTFEINTGLRTPPPQKVVEVEGES